MLQLWGLGGNKQVLHLPNCTYIELCRADDLDWLDIHAPELCNLSLESCYSLEHLRLHPKEGSPCRINAFGANIGWQSQQHLQKHPRVGSERVCLRDVLDDDDDDDDDDGFNGVPGGYPVPHMGGMNEMMLANMFQAMIAHYNAN